MKSTVNGGKPVTFCPSSSIGCSFTPSNTKPTLSGYPRLDEARVVTSARNNDESGEKLMRVCARGMKSMMFVAMGGFLISWYMALGAVMSLIRVVRN